MGLRERQGGEWDRWRGGITKEGRKWHRYILISKHLKSHYRKERKKRCKFQKSSRQTL